jgi:hypothetical protein
MMKKPSLFGKLLKTEWGPVNSHKCILIFLILFNPVHQNQYGFIQNRSIQDRMALSFEYLHLCHKCKKEIVILKLDFEKAFDKVEHEVILQVLTHKGFPK